jgi:hypothetical protein
MTFWLDVNIPPVMCAWLEDLGYVAHGFRSIGWLTESNGQTGNGPAYENGDSRELVQRLGPLVEFA